MTRTDYHAEVIADSYNVDTGNRVITFELTMPRIVLAEFNTHRMLTRNSASSRAIPVKKRLAAVLTNPFTPKVFGANKRGMQAGEDLAGWRAKLSRWVWLLACYVAVACAWLLSAIGVHKQIANRLIEPFSWHTVLVTATHWRNYFALRTHPDAQPQIQEISRIAKELFDTHEPERLKAGQWHMPLLTAEELAEVRELEAALPQGWHPGMGNTEKGAALTRWIKISAGRCARVSYLTHDGRRDPAADVKLCDRLMKAGHMSPLEHPAQALAFQTMMGNFQGFRQYRKFVPNESVFQGDR